jgi:ribosomal protein L28
MNCSHLSTILRTTSYSIPSNTCSNNALDQYIKHHWCSNIEDFYYHIIVVQKERNTFFLNLKNVQCTKKKELKMIAISKIKSLIQSNPNVATQLNGKPFIDESMIHAFNDAKKQFGYTSNIWLSANALKSLSVTMNTDQIIQTKNALGKISYSVNLSATNIEDVIAEFEEKQAEKREAKQVKKVSKRTEELNALRDENELLKNELERLKSFSKEISSALQSVIESQDQVKAVA